MARSIAFIDSEVGINDKKIHDLGAVRNDRATFHSASIQEFSKFIAEVEFLCGHILGHTNASFTLDTYTHVTSDMQRQASGIVGGFIEDLFGKELKPWQESEKTETEP